MPTLEKAALTSVAARFSETEPNEFANLIADLWTVADRVRNVITQSVEEGLCPPVSGCGIIATTQAQLFGYAEFTGIVNPSPLSAPLWMQDTNGYTKHQNS